MMHSVAGSTHGQRRFRASAGAAFWRSSTDHDGNTFRVVYTVKFAGVVYVLHAFQKKSRKGRATPQHNIEVVKARLKAAEAQHRETTKGKRS